VRTQKQGAYSKMIGQKLGLMGTSGNSIFVMIARHFRADDCMDAGGRATQDAEAE
jgi:hypothetical protein